MTACTVATENTNGTFHCTREAGHDGPCAAEFVRAATATFKAQMVGGPDDATLYETGIVDAAQLPTIRSYVDALDSSRDGVYRLVSWSKLPPDIDPERGVFRGARYVWEGRGDAEASL